MTKEQLAARIMAMEKDLQALNQMLRVQELEAAPGAEAAPFTGRIIRYDYRLGDTPRANLGCLL